LDTGVGESEKGLPMCGFVMVRYGYQVLPDESAARSNYIRVVDETGEDYLYPAELFVIIDVPAEAQKAFMQAVSS
jgi:hypothetical protein